MSTGSGLSLCQYGWFHHELSKGINGEVMRRHTVFSCVSGRVINPVPTFITVESCPGVLRYHQFIKDRYNRCRDHTCSVKPQMCQHHRPPAHAASSVPSSGISSSITCG